MADTPQPASPKRNTLGTNISGKKVPCSAPAMANKSSKQASSAVDMYWFAYAADPPAERHRRGLWAQQVDELASPEQEIEGAKSPGSRKESPCSPLDTYWFAHAGGDTPSEDAADHGASPDKLQADGDTGDHNHQQVSREERMRMVKERQEEERTRRLQEFQLHTQAAQQYREQQEEERRRRIEGLRHRDQERRQQVEERKRLIWEAEHERKEAVLRRSMDRDTKGEARRNANRMSASFAFGSSTPRTFDLDLATLGASGSSILMSSATNSRRSEERDFEASKKRAASSYNLCQAAEVSCEADSGSQRTAHFINTAFISPTTGGWLVGSGVTIGEDPMTRSMIVQSSQSNSSNIRGRRKTDLTPVIPWNRGAATSSRSRSPGTSSSTPGTAKRAVSMSRLDALAQPRRRFTHSDVTSAAPPSMAAKSMLNLASHPSSKKGASASKSMQLLVGGEPRLRQARSMCHLAVQPRQTRSSMLRTSKMSLSPAVVQGQGEHQSPSRPRSSMSMASEQSMQSSQASTVSLRPRPPQRKPRPLSIAGTIPDKSLSSSRPTFGAEKSGSSSPEKASRARSVTCVPPEVPPKPAHLRKPQKPQPPASSPSRREQRTAPKPSRSQPNLASKASALSSPEGEEQAAAAVQPVAGQVKTNQPMESRNGTALPKQNECQQKPHDSPEELANVPQPAEPTSVKEDIQNKESIEAEPSQVKDDSPVREGSPAKERAESKDGTPAKESGAECVPMKESTPVKERSAEPTSEEGTPSTKAPKVISEEEARALLAEKRRLAREQAEREAELERQRQEELRRQEEKRLRMEEEEQRRFEEEQIRLAEAFRKQEEEKLQRAIEEQAKREAEEQQRRELEAQQRAEREEQERRAKEEAEKQRKELEERLKREEAERAERKKRVEEIMSRTRRRGGARDSPTQGQKSSSPESDVLPTQESSVINGLASEGTMLLGSNESEATPSKMASENAMDTENSSQSDNKTSLNYVDAVSMSKGNTVEESVPVTAQKQVEEVVDCVKVIEQVEVLAPTTGKGERKNDLERVNASEQIVSAVVDRSVGGEAPKDVVKSQVVRENCHEVYSSIEEEVLCMEQSSLSKPTSPAFGSDEVHHTNGYSHNGGLQDSVVNGVSSGKVVDLLGLDSLSSMVPLKTEPTTNSSTAADHTVDNLINVDDINSNRVSGNPLIAFEEDNKNTKSQESPQLTDLLS